MAISKHNPTQQPSGFTIVELLIVVVVIAILAAITIVAYNGIQRRANESAAVSAVNQAKKKIGVWQVDNANQSPDQATFTSLIGANTTNLEYSPEANGAYCVTATVGTISYTATHATNPTSGGCPGHSQGGVATITNLHPNPGAVTSTGLGNWAGDSGSAAGGSPTAAAWAQSGSAYRVNWTAVTGTNGDLQVHANTNNVLTPGTPYTVRYTIVAGQNSTISAPTGYASAGSYTTLARSTTSDTVLTSGAQATFWATIQGDATALASTIRVLQVPRAKAAGHNYSISNIMIYQGAYDSSLGFYWAGSPSWVWNGAVNNSTSKGPAL